MKNALFIALFVATATLLSACANNTQVNSDIKIAKIQYGNINDLLTHYALSKPGNSETRKKYEDIKKKQKKLTLDSFSALSDDKTSMKDFISEVSVGFYHKDEEKIEMIAKAELLNIIDKLFADKYDLIVSDEFDDSILYTNKVIHDITPQIKQYLLRQESAAAVQKTDNGKAAQ